MCFLENMAAAAWVIIYSSLNIKR